MISADEDGVCFTGIIMYWDSSSFCSNNLQGWDEGKDGTT